jgi:hypothetical protein
MNMKRLLNALRRNVAILEQAIKANLKGLGYGE